jgi:hypothetical protein
LKATDDEVQFIVEEAEVRIAGELDCHGADA